MVLLVSGTQRAQLFQIQKKVDTKLLIKDHTQKVDRCYRSYKKRTLGLAYSPQNNVNLILISEVTLISSSIEKKNE